MFCPKCGTQLSDSSAFCRNCGAQLGAGSSPIQRSPQGQPPVQGYPYGQTPGQGHPVNRPPVRPAGQAPAHGQTQSGDRGRMARAGANAAGYGAKAAGRGFSLGKIIIAAAAVTVGIGVIGALSDDGGGGFDDGGGYSTNGDYGGDYSDSFDGNMIPDGDTDTGGDSYSQSSSSGLGGTIVFTDCGSSYCLPDIGGYSLNSALFENPLVINPDGTFTYSGDVSVAVDDIWDTGDSYDPVMPENVSKTVSASGVYAAHIEISGKLNFDQQTARHTYSGTCHISGYNNTSQKSAMLTPTDYLLFEYQTSGDCHGDAVCTLYDNDGFMEFRIEDAEGESHVSGYSGSRHVSYEEYDDGARGAGSEMQSADDIRDYECDIMFAQLY